MSQINDEIARRRTFAIISHPDAGKTTLTEKLLLFGGAIHMRKKLLLENGKTVDVSRSYWKKTEDAYVEWMKRWAR